MPTNNATIRKQIRQQRRQLDPLFQLQAAHDLKEQLKNTRLFQNSRQVACYIPMQGEMSPWPLIELAWDMGKQVYLPVLMPFLENRLWFAPFTPDTMMQNNKFGIPEPIYRKRQLIPANRLDLVLTPLVAFDSDCHRLGMGGGYYDRSFAFLRFRKHWKQPRLVGMAYEMQKVTKIQTMHWDVPLHAVFTEQKNYTP